MKFTDNVYALDSTQGNYAYLILGRETILIDTGMPWQGKKLLAELHSLGVGMADIKHILFTHHDIDHIGNAALLQKETGATLWASQEDIPFISGEQKRPGFKRLFASIGDHRIQGVQPYPADGKVEQITVIPTPGHTPGHVCLLYKDVLFIGDLLNNRSGSFALMPPFMTWNRALARQSAGIIESHPFKWICPAHGTPAQRVQGQPVLNEAV
jgi:glyoxylase-like metal-dependent hydrolase (beta-lactamase superfamily II)